MGVIPDYSGIFQSTYFQSIGISLRGGSGVKAHLKADLTNGFIDVTVKIIGVIDV